MSKFTAFRKHKSSLFRGARGARTKPRLPVDGKGLFPAPLRKDAITENITQDMKQRCLLKLQSDFEFLSALRFEAPRDDMLFKIRRMER